METRKHSPRQVTFRVGEASRDILKRLFPTSEGPIDWIHASKFSLEGLIERIKISKELNIPTIVDIGSLPRIRETSANPSIGTLPNGDLGVQVETGNAVILVPYTISSDQLSELSNIHPESIILRTSYIPVSFDQGEAVYPKTLMFGDSDIACNVAEAKYFYELPVLYFKVVDNGKTGYLYANHKINSRDFPLTEFHTPTSFDHEILEAIPMDLRASINYIALSFATVEGIQELETWLSEHGFSNASILAKIESLEGYKEIEKIAKHTDQIMLALGDLRVVCERENLELNIVIEDILKILRANNVTIWAASGLADSLIKGSTLTTDEYHFLMNLILGGVSRIGLTKETWVPFDPVNPQRIIQIIDTLNAFIRIALNQLEEKLR